MEAAESNPRSQAAADDSEAESDLPDKPTSDSDSFESHKLDGAEGE
jgi:hypothetical protein